MSRTILYHPEIRIPTSGTWIRKSLLYWDQLGAIVPQSYDEEMDSRELKRYSPEIECLYEEGLFKPYSPAIVMRDGEAQQKLLNEMRDTLSLPALAKESAPSKPHTYDFPIYKDKTSSELFETLKREDLATESANDTKLYLFEERTGRIYMALLAKHISAISPGHTVPSSDSGAEFNAIFGFDERHRSENLILSPYFADLIPTPNPDVPLRKIIDFKRKNEASLLAFQSAMEDFETKVAACEEIDELKSVLRSQETQIKKQTLDLSDAMKANTVGSWLGSLQSFIKPTSPTLLGASAVAFGKASGLATVPVSWVLAGAGIAGSIEVSVHWFNKVQERKAAVRNSPFAYLYLTKHKFA